MIMNSPALSTLINYRHSNAISRFPPKRRAQAGSFAEKLQDFHGELIIDTKLPFISPCNSFAFSEKLCETALARLK